MIKVGRTVKTHLWGILNAVQLRATNAIAESINATIQKIKARACGFRNRARFRTAILFSQGRVILDAAGICEVYPH
jgi:transposase